MKGGRWALHWHANLTAAETTLSAAEVKVKAS